MCGQRKRKSVSDVLVCEELIETWISNVFINRQRAGCTVSATSRITTGRTSSTQQKAVGMASW